MRRINTNAINIKNPNTGQFESIPGLIGKSAYDIAVSHGYTGTEAEYAEDIIRIKKLIESLEGQQSVNLDFGYTSKTEVELVTNETITVTSDSIEDNNISNNRHVMITPENPFSTWTPTPDEIYNSLFKVIWDDTEYLLFGHQKVKPDLIKKTNLVDYVFGNINLMGYYSEDSIDVPFIVVLSEWTSSNNTYSLRVITNDAESTSHTISISRIDIDCTKIPQYYLDTNMGNKLIESGSGKCSSMFSGAIDASGDYSFAHGSSTKSEGMGSHAEGFCTTATGKFSHSEGRKTIASGEGSHAEGDTTTASGNYSHAEGWSTTASASESHAEGYGTTASLNFAHAEGKNTTASGPASHSEGESTTASGNYSHAEGKNTTASGPASHSEGESTTASGVSSHAEGNGTTVEESANYSHAEGQETIVKSEYSHAEGYKTTVEENANYSHAEGNYTTASGIFSHAEGGGTRASNKASHAEGGATTASGEYSHAEGNSTTASANYSHAEGMMSKASIIGSHAEGYNTKASGEYSHTEGGGTATSGEYSHAEGSATNANGNHSHAEGVETTASGIGSHTEGYKTIVEENANYSHAEGEENTASGIGSHAEGYKTTASANYSHAEGQGTKVLGEGSHAEGYYTTVEANVKYSHAEGNWTTVSGNYSHAEGYYAIASGEYSHAEGHGAKASKRASHAEGCQTKASGEYSHAEGNQTEASGYYSHAEGNTTTASGSGSHAEGYSTIASGTYSHAEGDQTIASGTYSHAEGVETTALDYQHAMGHYNDTTNATAYSATGVTGTAFVIGNGTSSTKSNAFRVTGSGETYAKGSYNSTGADYAEFAEWADGNPDDEDRRGYFVTFDEEKPNMIRKANEGDYILGVISGNPCIIGNSDESWIGKYCFDEFGSYVYEDIEYEEPYTDIEIHVNEETGEEEEVIVEKTRTIKGKTYKLNPDFDPEREYIQRKLRKEWDYVGWMGVLSVRDDGTCIPGGYCKPTEGGIAIASERTPDSYRVLERLTDNVIKVVIK